MTGVEQGCWGVRWVFASAPNVLRVTETGSRRGGLARATPALPLIV